MRIKVLLCAAALAAASACTSMAQNVYSLNVVGYINIPLVEGFNFVANQLDYDGTGMNNTVANVLGTNLPVKTVVYTYANGTFSSSAYVAPKGGGTPAWSTPSLALNPGQGAIISVAAGQLSGTSSNLTIVGQVDQGSLVNTNLASGGGYSLVSSIVPLAGGITSVLGYTPAVSDAVYQFSAASQSYLPADSYVAGKGGGAPAWTPAEPSISVGQGFFLNSHTTSAWSNYFQVQ